MLPASNRSGASKRHRVVNVPHSTEESSTFGEQVPCSRKKSTCRKDSGLKVILIENTASESWNTTKPQHKIQQEKQTSESRSTLSRKSYWETWLGGVDSPIEENDATLRTLFTKKATEAPSGEFSKSAYHEVDTCMKHSWNYLKIRAVRQTERDARHRVMQPVYDMVIQNPQGVNVPVGLQLFEDALRLLDCFSMTRSLDQRQFHDAMMFTAAPLILQSDYLSFREALFQRFKRSSQNMATLILCPRRWGKSICGAMMIAVLLYVCRGINIVIFSTGSDCSSTFLQMVKDFFLQLPNANSRITVNRKDMICTLPADADFAASKSANNSRSRLACNTVMARSGNVVGTKILNILNSSYIFLSFAILLLHSHFTLQLCLCSEL
jgi:hypothetical protein